MNHEDRRTEAKQASRKREPAKAEAKRNDPGGQGTVWEWSAEGIQHRANTVTMILKEILSSRSDINVAGAQARPKDLAYRDDSQGTGRSNLDSEPRQAAPCGVEPRPQVPTSDTAGSARRTRHFDWLLGDNPYLVSFPFAFTVGMIIMVGSTLVVWGITVLSASMFLLGAIVTLLGLLLYGWSLSVED